MADTKGFEVVIQATQPVLKKAIRGAWKSADCPDDSGDEGRIPEFQDIDAGLVVGGYVIADGQVQIPEDELDAVLDPTINGAELILGMNVQLEIDNPPVPTASLLDFHAILHARCPIGLIQSTQDVGLLLSDMTPANAFAELDAGHPLDPFVDVMMQEFVHQAYENGGEIPQVDPFIPHFFNEAAVPFGPFTLDATTYIYDDEFDPLRQIEVSRPNPTTVRISIPIYLRMFNISLALLQAPMGIETRIVIDAPFENPPGLFRARLEDAVVTVDPIVGVGSDITGSTVEADNYNSNKAAANLASIDLDALIAAELVSKGEQMATEMGNFEISVPTKAEIEASIASIFYDELVAREFISLWTPTAANDEFQVDDVTTNVTSSAFNIGINAGAGANIGALGNIVPGGREFAIAISAAATNEMINDGLVESGFNSLPKRFEEDGKEVDLNSLNVSLVNNAIRLEGEVTVIDAILGSIDVDADFKVDVGLHWQPNGSLNIAGGQLMEHHIIGDPEVDPQESVLFWVIAIILTVLTFGAGGVLFAIITIIVILIVNKLVEKIGSNLLVDNVTNAIEGIEAWPPELSRIGRVRAVFHDPIDISTTGLVMAGNLEVLSSCESATLAAATTAGQYLIDAAQSLSLNALKTYSNSDYFWKAGDGSLQVPNQSLNHAYSHSGIYVAKHGLTVLDLGGSASRHFARVKVRNVPPVVALGPPIVINEGEVVMLEGYFEDVEWLDTHTAVWNFGDDQATESGTIEETNVKPSAKGVCRVKHAWCDNGEYTVSLLVTDVNGGIGKAYMQVTVNNVAPTVTTPERIYAYPCSPVTLVAQFTDPGWCDTHTGTWNFGDCGLDHMAWIEETNEKPEARGTASASHVYNNCGTYCALCTVIDDDGGVGKSQLCVDVVHLKNPSFELGFTQHQLGEVANEWQPFWRRNDDELDGALKSYTDYERVKPDQQLPQVYSCEKCCVYDGERSQRITPEGEYTLGIMQSIGANPEWIYQVSMMYQLKPGTAGTVMLGIDSKGGTNPHAESIVWVEGNIQTEWANLCVNTIAEEARVSVFIAVKSDDRNGTEAFLDKLEFIAIQREDCEEVEEPETTCVDFADIKPGTLLPARYDREGMTFITLDRRENRVILSPGSNEERCLELRKGEQIDLERPVNRVEIEFCFEKELPVTVIASDKEGTILKRVSANLAGIVDNVVVEAKNIASVFVQTGRAGGIVRVCVDEDFDLTLTHSDNEVADLEQVRGELSRIKASLIEKLNPDAVGVVRTANSARAYSIAVFEEGINTITEAQLAQFKVPIEVVSIC
jgi:hypothetical protein